MDVETLYWILSTLPQVIAALTGLLLTATTFVFDDLNESVRDNDTLEEIVYVIKEKIHKSTMILVKVSILAISIDVVGLILAPWLGDQIEAIRYISPQIQFVIFLYAIVVVWLNGLSFDYLVRLLNQILNPRFKGKIIAKLSKEQNEAAIEDKLTEDKGIEGEDDGQVDGKTENEVISPMEFLAHFRLFEQKIRQFFVDGYKQQNHQPLRMLVNELLAQGVIDKRDLKYINESMKIRNLYVHGGDITQVSRGLDDHLVRLTAELEATLPEYRKKYRKYSLEDIFLRWIDTNVKDAKDAQDLLQALHHEQSSKYKIYESDSRVIIEGQQKLRIDSKEEMELFVSLLLNNFSPEKA